MRWFHENPKVRRRTKLFEVIKMERFGMPPVKMVVGPFNTPVAGPFPAKANVIIHPILKTVEVREKDKPTYEVAMRNLNKIRRSDE